MTGTANSSVEIHHVGGFKKSALSLLGYSVRHWQQTLQYDGVEQLTAAVHASTSGSLFLLWHNRLFSTIGAMQQVDMRGRRVVALVSASRDGAQLSNFLEAVGIQPVRGSSSRRGAVAARELLKLLNAGDHIAITVDGPRGPCYRSQAGAALLVQMTGAPICCLGAESESCFELNSWDRFIIPRPFSRVKIKLDRFHAPNLEKGREQREAIQVLIQEKLTSLTRDSHREA
jgi:lysophospholipid acyltransferase (LPLAT)-like uncharacterized protein